MCPAKLFTRLELTLFHLSEKIQLKFAGILILPLPLYLLYCLKHGYYRVVWDTKRVFPHFFQNLWQPWLFLSGLA